MSCELKFDLHRSYSPQPGQINILVVDDNILVRDLLRLGLSRTGYCVTCANGGKQAISLLKNTAYDLVLLDIIMPDYDGLEILQEIREVYSRTELPVIMVTAVDESTKIVRALELGANDYVTKPIDVPVVLARLKTHLTLREIQHQLAEKNRMLEKIATIDELTGIPNRRYFNQYFGREWDRAKKLKNLMSIIFCDVDYFKAYNDYYGHQKGDDCLRSIARLLQNTARRSIDLVARYGGEEFVIVLPGTDTLTAQNFAERLRFDVERMHLPHKNSEVASYVTISLGVTTATPTPQVKPSDILVQVDQLLYQAKRSGRNRVITHLHQTK